MKSPIGQRQQQEHQQSLYYAPFTYSSLSLLGMCSSSQSSEKLTYPYVCRFRSPHRYNHVLFGQQWSWLDKSNAMFSEMRLTTESCTYDYAKSRINLWPILETFRRWHLRSVVLAQDSNFVKLNSTYTDGLNEFIYFLPASFSLLLPIDAVDNWLSMSSCMSNTLFDTTNRANPAPKRK